DMIRPGTLAFRAAVIGVLSLLLALPLALRRCGERAPRVRVATFNIRLYPESARQVEGAFEVIRALRAEAVALQEIQDPAHLGQAARARLGPAWRFVYPATGPRQRVGVLFNEEMLALESLRSYEETVIYPGGKPALEVRLRQRSGAE